jgi:hypothetical protein
MKKAFQVLGVLFVVLLLALGIFIGVAAHNGSKLDASSKEYVDANVPPIVNAWSTTELLKRASPELRKVASPSQLTQLFAKLSLLGSLTKYEGAKGDSFVSFTPKEGKVITANYEAAATFEKGPATIKIGLIQESGQWMILKFYVDSPLFLK